jgi:hypothetical protein
MTACDAPGMKLLVAGVLSLCPSACAPPLDRHLANPTGPQRTLVELWAVGDDGLSLRFADAVREEFRQSDRFSLVAVRGNTEALKVIIPENVRPEPVGTRMRATYRLELERGGTRLVAKGGSCWATELRQCAQQVMQTVAATRE